VANGSNAKTYSRFSRRPGGGKSSLPGSAALQVSAEGKEALGSDRRTGHPLLDRLTTNQADILEMNLDSVTPQTVSQTPLTVRQHKLRPERHGSIKERLGITGCGSCITGFLSPPCTQGPRSPSFAKRLGQSETSLAKLFQMLAAIRVFEVDSGSNNNAALRNAKKATALNNMKFI
jgi:hypothetical protein